MLLLPWRSAYAASRSLCAGRCAANGRGPGPARSTGDGGFRCTSTLGRCATGAVERRAGKPPGADGYGWSFGKMHGACYQRHPRGPVDRRGNAGSPRPRRIPLADCVPAGPREADNSVKPLALA